MNYRYGASVKDALRKLEYDLYYIKNMSLLLDFKIILKTIGMDGWKKTEGGGQRTEDRGRRSEVRCQKTEGEQKIEIRR